MSKQVDAWTATVKRYDSDPKEKDGRKELRAQAEQYEHARDTAMARYHNYELGSAAYQIGIVLASAAVITGMIALVYGSMGVAAIGMIFTGFGLFAPHVPHDILHWVSIFFDACGRPLALLRPMSRHPEVAALLRGPRRMRPKRLFGFDGTADGAPC